MKLPGAVLIMAAACLASAVTLQEKKRSQEGCLSLATALDLLRAELSSGAVPLSLGIERACAHAGGIGKELLCAVYAGLRDLGEQSFDEIWDKALAGTDPRLAENSEHELQKLGSVLGRFDLETQLRALDACSSLLRRQWERQRNAYPEERRVWIGLTTGLGALLVILLY
ncbi:MAG: stage III sporulation protein AB [Oscillospiraceae bacterium]|jgi:stage III sporulation protein AB|nr:stage III sporulation protein AB [Oscillospiraceae bacterium]